MVQKYINVFNSDYTISPYNITTFLSKILYTIINYFKYLQQIVHMKKKTESESNSKPSFHLNILNLIILMLFYFTVACALWKTSCFLWDKKYQYVSVHKYTIWSNGTSAVILYININFLLKKKCRNNCVITRKCYSDIHHLIDS